jgi:hypothetical protein
MDAMVEALTKSADVVGAGASPGNNTDGGGDGKEGKVDCAS